MHAHLAPVNPRSLEGIDGVQWLARDEALLVDNHRIGIKALFEPQRLIEWLDQSSVRRAWVSIPPPLYRQQLSRRAAAAWVGYLNAELLAVCAASHGRLEALYYLPLEHPDLLSELCQQCTDEFVGVALAAGGASGHRVLARALRAVVAMDE